VHYRFLTAWLLRIEVGPVWDAIYDAERWPEWWPGVESVVELDPGGELKVGSVSRQRWRSRLPYVVEFESRTTRVEPPWEIDGSATGDLEGEGRWRLFERDGVTVVLYQWEVRTTSRWMNLLAPALRPAFRWNHDAVMRNGGEGLARRLGAQLVTAS
jgi:carbon monoxide dehydrogenase subunit G